MIYILAGWLFPEAFCGESIRRTGRPRVGLVLSGGGAKGMAHVGALKVIEELGIPIDYIGGTSMGSIVGGLYAIGYTSTQLETYMRETDWAYLFTGKVLRRNVSIYEKGERKRYWLQFAVTGGRINLPLGILRGQNVSNLLTELASPAYAQMDFSKLPVPFLCIATDIASGTEVVLEHGDLARAIRASMAIPSVFTPENIDGHNLYDGGLVNNFPADKLRDKGMDILIGVDVTSPAGETELNNIYQVMEQVVFMASLPLKEANKKLCRILITPDITGYGASSFGAADSLIARGERAARQQYGALKALADSLRSFETGEPGEHGLCSQPLPSFYVRDVKIKGLKHISEDFFMQKLKLEAPAVTTFQELDKAIERLNGTQVFESVVYRLNPLPDGEVELQFDCIEQGTNLFRVGLHYDREYKASLLLNQTYRNILLNNSKALIDVAIGENPSFMLSYFHSPGLKPVGKTLFKSTLSPDWQFYINGYMIDAYNYTGKQRTSAYSVSSLNTGIQLMITPSVNSVIGSGVHGAYTMIDNRVGGEDEDIKSNYLYLNYNFFYERDTYNQDYFPTQGGKFRLTASYNKGVSKNVRYSDGFFGVVFRSNLALTPIHRWTIHSGIDAGSMFGTDIPPHFMMYLGGNPGKHWRNELDFSGMYFMQKYAENAWAIHLNNQVCLWSNIYLIFRVNLGKTEPEFADMFTLKDFWAGYGVSLQYNSVVGPLGFTFSSSNATHSLTGAINIGFWF